MGEKKKEMGTLKSKNDRTQIKRKLIILHGWSYSTEKWNPFLRILKGLGVDATILKIPGLTAPLDSAWSIEDYIEWLKKEVSTVEQKTAILGHSNGGRIASAFCAKYPDRVSKLILLDSAGMGNKNLKNLLKKFLFRTVAKGGKKITKSASVKNLLYKIAGEHDYNKANPLLKETMINLTSKDLSHTFSQIKVPTFIIWGRDDKITPLSSGNKINKLVPNSKLHIINGARHSPQFTHADLTAKLVADFLKDDNYGNI